MSLFQHVSIWSLRALLLWGAFEAAASLYGEATSQLEKLGEIRGHEAAMKRLDERARTAERALRIEQARLAAVQRLVWTPAREAQAPAAPNVAAPASARTPPDPGEVIAAALRADLMEFGASEAMLETVEAPLSGDLKRIAIEARWREPVGASPSVLDRLAARRPNIALAELALERPDGAAFVQARARFEAIARAPRARAKERTR